jgi:hypothetical protein
LLEVGVAGVLMAALVSLAVKALALAAAERRAAEQHMIALTEAGNVAERIAALPWEKTTPEALAEIKLPAGAERSLGNVSLEVTSENTEEGPKGRRVRVSLRWKLPSGADGPPIDLSLWTYAPPPAQGVMP